MISDKHSTKHITISGQKVPVWIFGNVKKPLIIFIHGFPTPFSGLVGDLPITYLQDMYCIISFDLPGFGKSKNITTDAIMFIKQIIDKIAKKKKVSLFGVSFGGVLALKYAYYYPDHVDKIIIAGTPYYTNLDKLFRYITLPDQLLTFKTVNILLHFVFLEAQNLSQIKNDVLLLYSKKDLVGTIRMAKKLAAMIPRPTYIETKTRNHSWLLRRIDENEFLEAIQRFLSSSQSK